MFVIIFQELVIFLHPLTLVGQSQQGTGRRNSCTKIKQGKCYKRREVVPSKTDETVTPYCHGFTFAGCPGGSLHTPAPE